MTPPTPASGTAGGPRAEPSVGRGHLAVVQRSADRFVTATPGTLTRHAFSFGGHYDPENVSFGPLQVCNEDLVEIGAGYDEHPHRDAEIVTWVLSGSLVHTDSYGNAGIISPGLAQRMSAGTGIVHAERNDAFHLENGRPHEPVHFLQLWLRPDHPGGTPGYAQRELPMGDLSRHWLPIASGDRAGGVSIGVAGATVWVTRLVAGAMRELPEAASAYLHVAAGRVEVEGVGLVSAGAAVRVTGPAALRVTGVTSAEVLVLTLGADRHGGFALGASSGWGIR